MIKTNLHAVKNAARWKEANANNTWIVLGQTSAWPSEPTPPAEVITTTSINQAFCAIKATIQWVVADELGTIYFTGLDNVLRTYSEVTTLAALATDVASTVLISATVTGDQIASLFSDVAPTWRQLGVYTDLVPAVGYTTYTFIAAANVGTWGQLEVYDNRTPISLPNSGSFYTVQTMIQYANT